MASASAMFLLQSDSSRAIGAMFGGVMLLVWFAILLVFVIAMWRVFEKAGQPGWAVLIPFYNTYVMLKIVGRPGWWLLLYFIPLVNLVVAVIVSMDLAKSFGQSAAWGVVLLFILFGVGYLILGFDSSRYMGPAADPNGRVSPVPA